MIELLILGLILFIAGVGGTVLYDKHKEYQASRPAPIPKPSAVTRKRPGPKSMQDINEEFLAKFSEHMKQQPKARAKRASLTQKDLNTLSTLTVEELIAKIEDMKKKL